MTMLNPNAQNGLRRRLSGSVALALALAMALAGCATRSPAPATPPAAEDSRKTFAVGLAVEQRWLDSWFRGTPVVIALNDDGELIVDVPREFCFEPGGSRIKPALAAVLDKMAQVLHRMRNARLTLLAAPDDKAPEGPLAVQRAAQVHKLLQARGVRAEQLVAPTATRYAAVQLRIGPAP